MVTMILKEIDAFYLHLLLFTHKIIELNIFNFQDVTGRGIDFPMLDLVIQYSPPQKIPDFVHRVGRTARAGKSGKAILFLGPSETQFVRKLEDKRIRIAQETMESYLNPIKQNDGEANTVQEACSNLQYTFEQLMDDDRELMNKGKKGECKHFSKQNKIK